MALYLSKLLKQKLIILYWAPWEYFGTHEVWFGMFLDPYCVWQYGHTQLSPTVVKPGRCITTYVNMLSVNTSYMLKHSKCALQLPGKSWKRVGACIGDHSKVKWEIFIFLWSTLLVWQKRFFFFFYNHCVLFSENVTEKLYPF